MAPPNGLDEGVAALGVGLQVGPGIGRVKPVGLDPV